MQQLLLNCLRVGVPASTNQRDRIFLNRIAQLVKAPAIDDSDIGMGRCGVFEYSLGMHHNGPPCAGVAIFLIKPDDRPVQLVRVVLGDPIGKYGSALAFNHPVR